MYLEIADGDLDETERARDDLKRAFALRETVTGWRKDWIDALYYLQITGEIYKAIDALRSWESLQPNQFPPTTGWGSPTAILACIRRRPKNSAGDGNPSHRG